VKLIILGIDPGIAIVGYGIIEYKNSRFRTLAFGAIQTPAHTPVESRLLQIHKELSELIDLYHPDAMAVEELFFNTNATTGIIVAEARGIILLCAAEKNVAVYEYTPLQVKQAVVGYGKATKAQVILMVKTFLSLADPPKLDDTCDALAIAICHAHTGGSRLREFYNLR
jgi:crossover junction endodeoxyribonuclease RuvC